MARASANMAEPAGLAVKTIAGTRDLDELSRAAADLTCCLHQDPAKVPAGATAALIGRLRSFAGKVPAGTRLPPSQTPERPLPEAERPAASAVLSALLDLLREREQDRDLLRQPLTTERVGTESSLIDVFLAVLTEGPGDAGGAAFVHACHLLALVASDDGEVAKALRNARVLDLVSLRLFRATGSISEAAASTELGTWWGPFATAATHLIERLLNAEDLDCLKLGDPRLFKPSWSTGRRPEVMVDGLLRALDRSLLRDGGSMVVQPLHLDGLRALSAIAAVSENQAHHMIISSGLKIGTRVLRIAGADQEAVVAALHFVAQVAAASPHSHRQLAELGAAELAQKAMARYPSSQTVQCEASLLLQVCQPH